MRKCPSSEQAFQSPAVPVAARKAAPSSPTPFAILRQRLGNAGLARALRQAHGAAAGPVEGRASPHIARTPRSLGETVDPRALSDEEIEVEIREIRRWLTQHPEDSPDRALLTAAMASLEAHVLQSQAAAAPAPRAASPGRPRPAASPAVERPRSLGQTPDISNWTPDEVQDEIRRIGAWLQAHPTSSADNEALRNTLSVLEQSVREQGGRRAPAAPPTSAPSRAPTGAPPFFGLPIAPNAVHGAWMFHIIRTVPHTDRVRLDTVIRRGVYTIAPQLVVGPDGSESIAYYIAFRTQPGLLGPTNWNEWVIGPDTIEEFLTNLRSYEAQGAFAYNTGPPSETRAASERWLWGTGTYGEALGTAVRDPSWWMQMVIGLSGAVSGPAGEAGAAGEATAARTAAAESGAGAAAAPQPWVPRVIQGGGGGAPAVSSGAGAGTRATASAFDGTAARALETEAATVPAAAPAPLRAVPEPAPAAVPAPAAAPAVAPGAGAGTGISPLVASAGVAAAGGLAAPATGPATAPSAQPQPAPDERERRGRCPPGSRPILWPFPVWAALGHGDAGATSGIFDRPPGQTVTKLGTQERNRTIIGEYVRENWAALSRYYQSGTLGAIHHKWPLYLGGPDSKANFVFLLFGEHTAWHSALSTQTTGPIGTVYCIVN